MKCKLEFSSLPCVNVIDRHSLLEVHQRGWTVLASMGPAGICIRKIKQNVQP